MKNEIERLLGLIKSAKENPDKNNILPQSAYFLSKSEIVCFDDRKFGVSRYPYGSDGLIVAAYSNGIIEAFEGGFHVFKPIYYCEEPTINFFGGVLENDGKYTPVSLFDTSKQLCDKVDRYTVYSNKCVYYIADSEKVTFALRLHVDDTKHIRFSLNAFNKTNQAVSVYLLSMFEAIIRFCEHETFWHRLTKEAHRFENGIIIKSENNCLSVKSEIMGGNIASVQKTVARRDITGNKRSIINSECLLTGKFIDEHSDVHTTELPIAADITRLTIEPFGEVRQEFDVSYHFSYASAKTELETEIDILKIDEKLLEETEKENRAFDNLKIEFSDFSLCAAGVFNKFLRTVQKQVNVCALGKNYCGPFLGVRDVMQQLESCLMWQPADAREKIVSALNYILDSGRPPRQFMVSDGDYTEMDQRRFIDQGVWVISTVYSYLAFTGDFSILEENCGYFEENNIDTYTTAKRSQISDSVLCHLIRIIDFLVSNLDDETDCLHIMFGDWNDALDGLGKTKREGQSYGTGVSVMATAQLYQNCREMVEILEKTGEFVEKIDFYKACEERIKNGLLKHAVVEKEQGDKRILHGWGDQKSYLLGSFCDPDGKSRISSTAHSFWAISGMVKEDKSTKLAVKTAFEGLNGKYGLLTFSEPFVNLENEAGRISAIVPGTYENAATYVHGAMFGAMALFNIGESEMAWKELLKATTITHENCNMSPFVMPNSFCHNDEYGIDGESMGDWYTGSGTVLIKTIVRCGFGVVPTLDGLWVQTADFMPCSNAEISLYIKGKMVTVKYENKHKPQREFMMCGNKVGAEFDDLLNAKVLFIPNDEIKDGMVITVAD